METTEPFDLQRIGVGILGKAVKVELIRSVLKGDDFRSSDASPAGVT